MAGFIINQLYASAAHDTADILMFLNRNSEICFLSSGLPEVTDWNAIDDQLRIKPKCI